MKEVSGLVGNLREAINAKFHEQGVLDASEKARMIRMAGARGFGLNPAEFDRTGLGPLIHAPTTNVSIPPQQSTPVPPASVPVSPPGAPSLLGRLAPGILLALGIGGAGAGGAALATYLNKPTAVSPAGGNDIWWQDEQGQWHLAPVLTQPPK